LGSFEHFLESLVNNTFSDVGYIVEEIEQVPNPDRPPQEVITKKLKEYRKQIRQGNLSINLSASDSDSLRYWSRMQKLPEFRDSVGRKHISNELLISNQNELVYQGYLKITYTKEPEEPAFAETRIGGVVDIKQTSTIYIYEPFRIYENAYFDPNKVLLNGYFGWSSRLAEMLPMEYRPEN